MTRSGSVQPEISFNDQDKRTFVNLCGRLQNQIQIAKFEICQENKTQNHRNHKIPLSIELVNQTKKKKKMRL